MKYYAKVYTGDPKLGLLTPGEFLTGAQVEALGAEKIAELCERGILEALGEPGASSMPAEPQGKKEAPKAADEGTMKTPAEDVNKEPEEETEAPKAADEGTMKTPAEDVNKEPEEETEEPKAADEGTEEPTEESATEEPEEEAEELPELDSADDLISEAEEEKPAKKTTKSGGRRK